MSKYDYCPSYAYLIGFFIGIVVGIAVGWWIREPSSSQEIPTNPTDTIQTDTISTEVVSVFLQ